MKKSFYQLVEDVPKDLRKHAEKLNEQEEIQAMLLLNQIMIQEQLSSIESAQAEMLLQSVEV